MTEKLAALSVDLDEIDCYASIHGVSMSLGERPIYEHAVPRFERLFDDEGIRATFFVIGRDARKPANDVVLRRLHGVGHELANHSSEHLYDLTRRSRDEVRREIEGGMEAIARLGATPSGFRAPGYTITDLVLRELEALSVQYDSSVFPCPAYYGAKTAMIGAIALRGRKSRSVVDDPRVLLAPADPYRVGAPYYARGSGIVELPIGVTSLATGRLPYIGTSVMAGELTAKMLTRAIATRPLVNLELHGIDLSDAARDGLTALAAHQPDLRRTAEDKERALRVAIHELRAAEYRFVTLREAAERV